MKKKAPQTRPSSRKNSRSEPSRPPKTATLGDRREALDEALTGALTRLWPTGARSEARPSVEARWSVGAPEAKPTGNTPAHWHLVTFGLFGWGHEVSLRVVRDAAESAPPEWAFRALEELAKAVSGGASLVEGQVVRLPTALGAAQPSDAPMNALTFAPDASVGVLSTKHDTVRVLSAFGLLPDEVLFLREWNPLALLELYAGADPLFVVDPERQSMLANPRTRMAVAQRAEREGSAMGVFQAAHSSLHEGSGGVVTWRMSADDADTVLALLKGRTAHQRAFTVKSGETTVDVNAAAAPAADLFGDSSLRLNLSQPAARAVRSTLRAKPGTYTWDTLPRFVVEVVASGAKHG